MSWVNRLDTLAPTNGGYPITPALYADVLTSTAREAWQRNGLYHTELAPAFSIQTAALLQPPGVEWLPAGIAREAVPLTESE